ncbi:hypothetical protein JY96_00730 [Aquabacterium sp. NJ1]|nr:hypothetical protein JY96_00730 [Aquabacterium sp. NJ1]
MISAWQLISVVALAEHTGDLSFRDQSSRLHELNFPGSSAHQVSGSIAAINNEAANKVIRCLQLEVMEPAAIAETPGSQRPGHGPDQ